MMEKENPVVSVCMITYNHEKYIRDAIESVLMQKTNYPIELTIGDDCSTDNTRKICFEYQQNHPCIINILDSNSNLGVVSNLNLGVKQAKAQYIALCEGNEYWIDEYKLSKSQETR